MDAIVSNKDTNKVRIDGTSKNIHVRMYSHPSFDDARSLINSFQKRDQLSSTLFSRGKRTRTFFTFDSHRYITPLEREALLERKYRYERRRQFDSVQIKYSQFPQSASELLQQQLTRRYASIKDTLRYFPDMVNAHISPMRVWNASIIGAMLFGMFSMTLIYRYLGQQASAESVVMNELPVTQSQEAPEKTDVSDNDTLKQTIITAPTIAVDVDQERFNAEVKDMVKGYPIENMLPYILKQDRDVASFLISIAKKESNWGKRVPVRNGHDCYNYWGYRGVREKMGTGGHTCFDGPEDAVNTVSKRIKTLVQEDKRNTPAKMIIWKCGGSCAGHSKQSVRKWISDVDAYLPDSK